ncbi:hypothetical protein EGW08_002077 [Elysia chlorotica]|uniref:Uncharacterized protein n=1 Tax=Elysia chlorotica TaxID=188477 RepID=A0A3S1BW52_ELYCH|nr:hypothetical protein EGW08_002077 [Elysia chlorotica]
MKNYLLFPMCLDLVMLCSQSVNACNPSLMVGFDRCPWIQRVNSFIVIFSTGETVGLGSFRSVPWGNQQSRFSGDQPLSQIPNIDLKIFRYLHTHSGGETKSSGEI